MIREYKRVLIALVILAVIPAAAFAQRASRAEIDAAIDARVRDQWRVVVAEAAKEFGLTVVGGRLDGARDAKARAYTRAIERLMADAELEKLVTPAYVQSLIDERVESRVPTSVNASSTNPATAGLPERSGSTALAALAADLSSIANSDKSAVSLNLSGLAFVGLRDTNVYSALANYQRHSFARRISGTFVFGAKVPEKEVTGLSSLPEFSTLFDAFGWDAKIRVVGDKDPRSARWSPLTVRTGGLLTQRAALILSQIGTTARAGESPQQALEDTLIVQKLLQERVGRGVADIKDEIAKSPQLSVKVAGTHLTKEVGRNKYSVAALFDVGAGPSDITANVQYAVTDDVRLGAAQIFQVKVLTVSGEVTSHLAPDVIVPGRTLDWSAGATVAMFQDKASLPVRADNTFKIFTRIEVPVKGGGRIPVSVIYSNDPNALTKERFVTGQIGLSYDFGALKQLFGS